MSCFVEPDAGERLVDRLHHEVVDAAIPVLAERRASDADDGNAVTNAVGSHQLLLGPVGPSKSSCGCRRW